MNVLAPHFAVQGVIDLQMLTQEIGSEHQDLPRVDKRPKCIAQCEQECLQVLSALTLGDVPENRGDRSALGVPRTGTGKPRTTGQMRECSPRSEPPHR